MASSVVFIHGFLGQPSDWDPVIQKIPPGISVYNLDLNRDFEARDLTFENWPKAYQNVLKEKEIEEPDLVVGYSLGGRLALALLDAEVIKNVVLLGSHFGLSEEQKSEREAREKMNQAWSEKILSLEWPLFLQQWNSQDIFKGSGNDWRRRQGDFNRKHLVQMLKGFSLACQKDFTPLLEKNNWKGLYLVGEQDEKYRSYAERLKIQPGGPLQIKAIARAGHRLPLDQPQIVAEQIRWFLTQIKA